MQQFEITRSEFEGHAQDVLQIRNRNRVEQRTSPYIYWRYQGQKGVGDSDVFFVTCQGEKVGMASVIRRPYFVDGKRKHFLILGDISLDKKYRGTGAADQLFSFINDFYSGRGEVGFVFPNSAAERVVITHGWSYIEPLVHNVILLNPYDKIKSVVKNHAISVSCSRAFRLFLGLRLSLVDSSDYILKVTDNFSDIFNDLFNKLQKNGYVIADKHIESLRWRYSEEFFGPRIILTFWKHNEFVGFCIYKYGFNETACCVYEFLCLRKADVKYCLKLLMEKMIRKKMTSIRIMLNKAHPYTGVLRSYGFVGRNEGAGVYGFGLIELIKRGNNSDLIMVFSSADKDI